MAIGIDDTIPKFGTQDNIDNGSTAVITNGSFSVLADITPWTNDEDAPFASFVGKFRFDTAMPTVGSIDLYVRLLNIDGTNEPNVPNDSYVSVYIGTFKIDFSVAFDVDFFTTIENAVLPLFQTSQIHEFYIRNNGTGQTIGINWMIKITPYTFGPKA